MTRFEAGGTEVTHPARKMHADSTRCLMVPTIEDGRCCSLQTLFDFNFRTNSTVTTISPMKESTDVRGHRLLRPFEKSFTGAGAVRASDVTAGVVAHPKMRAMELPPKR
jgi:hypothetical protein